jgi:protein-tyrosine phosphatase
MYGMSRSVTVVIAYLMCYEHLSMAQALTHVKRARPVADPNMGFITQLEVKFANEFL